MSDRVKARAGSNDSDVTAALQQIVRHSADRQTLHMPPKVVRLNPYMDPDHPSEKPGAVTLTTDQVRALNALDIDATHGLVVYYDHNEQDAPELRDKQEKP